MVQGGVDQAAGRRAEVAQLEFDLLAVLVDDAAAQVGDRHGEAAAGEVDAEGVAAVGIEGVQRGLAAAGGVGVAEAVDHAGALQLLEDAQHGGIAQAGARHGALDGGLRVVQKEVEDGAHVGLAHRFVVFASALVLIHVPSAPWLSLSVLRI